MYKQISFETEEVHFGPFRNFRASHSVGLARSYHEHWRCLSWKSDLPTAKNLLQGTLFG